MAQTPEGTSSFKDLSAANLLELLYFGFLALGEAPSKLSAQLLPAPAWIVAVSLERQAQKGCRLGRLQQHTL